MHSTSTPPLFQTLWTYWAWTFAPVNAHNRTVLVAIFPIALIGFVFYQWRQAKRLPLFFLLWFFVTLGPLLPLRDHISEYYLAIPVLGIGAILALAVTQGSPAVRFAAPVFAILFLAVHVPLARFGTRWYLGHTRAVRNLVWGVQQARKLHPDKTILLTGVSDDLYLDSLAHSVFRTLDIPDVYLAPELAAAVVRLDTQNPDALNNVLPPGPTVHALQKEILQVYSVSGDRLRNITSLYERTATAQFGGDPEKYVPQRVDAGVPLLGYLLGSTWYPPVGNFRWMPSRASFRIGVPRIGNANLILNGFCPPEQTRSGPLTLAVLVNGVEVTETKFFKPETTFSRTFVLPPEMVGQQSAVEITLVVDRTLKQTPDSPPLGLAFGVFQIR